MNSKEELNNYLSTDSLNDYLREISNIPLLTPEEEKELGYRILKGDEEAVNKMIVHNLRYVVSVAKYYKNFGLPLMDLIGEGNIGLIEAVNHFDVTKGFRFTTYAKSWIAQKIELGIINTSRTIRIPQWLFNELIKYRRTKLRLTQSLNRIPTPEELSIEMGKSIEKIKQYEEIIRGTLSLNDLLSNDNNVEIGEVLPSSEYSLEEETIRKDLPNEIRKMFEVLELDDIDIDVIVKRYGLDGQGIRKYYEIGTAHNRSRAWAQQREAKVLTKIRNSKYFKDTFYD